LEKIVVEALMPRYLEVYLYNYHIGWLCEAGRATRFIPTEGYLADRERPTISLSLTVPGQNDITAKILNNHFSPATYNERGQLPPFFAGLLPEGKLRQRLEATRKNKRDCDDFGILAAAGEDLPGAIKVIPADLDRLTASARAYGVTGGSDNLEISVPEAATEGAASVSGEQNKMALSMAHEGKRFVLPVKGKLSDIIAKFPIVNDDSQIFNEYVSMSLAAKAGVNIAKCTPRPITDIDLPDLAILYGADSHFLAVERFDRTPGGAVHIEDGCQLQTMMPTKKYAPRAQYINFLRVLDRLSNRGTEDVRQFIIRQVVNTLLGNSDAHLKNFSVIYRNGVDPELSPAYDIVSVVSLPNFLGYPVNVEIDRRQRQETLDTYRDIAKDSGLSERIIVTAAKDTIELAREFWPQEMQNLNASEAIMANISDRLDNLPLCKQ
jgi:serine/threonine-protein kinase HipA